VHLSNGVVAVKGTSFFIDCRQTATCYVVGIDRAVDVTSTATQATMKVGKGDCAAVKAEGLEKCEAAAFSDAWVRENLAEDERLNIKPAKPSTTTVPQQRIIRRRVVHHPTTSRPAPVPTATKAPTPAPTKKPAETAEPAPTDTGPTPPPTASHPCRPEDAPSCP
jgi:hypothetical protein